MILFSSDTIDNIYEVGGKAYGLAKLISCGYNVPEFFVVPANQEIDSDEFKDELCKAISRLSVDKFAVRSSGIGEDSVNNSFAGQFLTRLNVSADGVYAAIKQVRDSALSAGFYADAVGISQCRIAVIVQRQLDPQKAGVLFTSSPIEAEKSIIESVNGVAENLVSGNIIPDKTVVSYSNDTDLSKLESRLYSEGKRLEKIEGRPLDIEWAYDDKLYFLQMRPITALSDKIPNLPDGDWRFYVEHDFCAFCNSIQARASNPKLQDKTFGFSLPIFEGCVVNGNEFYTVLNDQKQNDVWRELDTDDFFGSFVNRIKRVIENARRYLNKVMSTDYTTYSNSMLFKAFDRCINVYLKTYMPMMMRPDSYLEQKIVSRIGDEKYRSVMSVLSAEHKKGYYADEKVDFLSSVVSGDFSQYIKKYEWINNPLGRIRRSVSLDDVKARAVKLTDKQAKQRLSEIRKQRNYAKKKVSIELEKVRDDDLKRLLLLLVRFVYLRSYVAENSDRFFYYFRKKILEEIASRFGLREDEISMMTYEETGMLRYGHRVSAEELRKRKRGETIMYLDGKTYFYFGQDSYRLLKKLKGELMIENDKIVRGEIVCQGMVIGRVRIVNNVDRAKETIRGEIVVASMTTPDIVAALECAGGIITDEGGVTCHAAIIAREYGVPCLVGTGIATAVLKDGMRVKLNCVDGYFEVIEE